MCPQALPVLSRRAALAGVPALVATGAASAATVSISPASPDCARIRALATELHAAIWREIDAETAVGSCAAERDPTWIKARATADHLTDRFEEVSEQVWEAPVHSWADVQARAEIARRWLDPDRHGRVKLPEDSLCSDQYALMKLLQAVLAMGGEHV